MLTKEADLLKQGNKNSLKDALFRHKAVSEKLFCNQLSKITFTQFYPKPNLSANRCLLFNAHSSLMSIKLHWQKSI